VLHFYDAVVERKVPVRKKDVERILTEAAASIKAPAGFVGQVAAAEALDPIQVEGPHCAHLLVGKDPTVVDLDKVVLFVYYFLGDKDLATLAVACEAASHVDHTKCEKVTVTNASRLQQAHNLMTTYLSKGD
jgi:hypothetical protein